MGRRVRFSFSFSSTGVESVRELVGQCTCPLQFPMVKVGEGKYRIGDSNIINVRMTGEQVMVRVGGGWGTLESYLDKHYPCHCRVKGHQGGLATTTRTGSVSTTTTAPSPSSLRGSVSKRASFTKRSSPSCSNIAASTSFQNSSIPGSTSSSSPTHRPRLAHTPQLRSSPVTGRFSVGHQQSSECRDEEKCVITTPPTLSPNSRRKLQRQKASDTDTVLTISRNSKGQHSVQVQKQGSPASLNHRRRQQQFVSLDGEQARSRTSGPRDGLNFQPRSILKKRDPEIPPEDPEMYKKLEMLYEEYREMELSVSYQNVPGNSSRDSFPAGAASTLIRNGNASNRSFPNPYVNDDLANSSVTHRPDQTPIQIDDIINMDAKTIMKNPSALVSKVKDILQVRPRKDKRGKGTRIPAPSPVSQRNGSLTREYSDFYNTPTASTTIRSNDDDSNDESVDSGFGSDSDCEYF